LLKKQRLDFTSGWVTDKAALGTPESLTLPLDILEELLEEGGEGALDKIALLISDDEAY
jgi:hypothetical protein